jgi:predicted hydrocarbon binding protein
MKEETEQIGRGRGEVLLEDEEAMVLKLAMQTLMGNYEKNPVKSRKLARDFGYQVGKDLARRFVSTDPSSTIEELSALLKRTGIGGMTWKEKGNRRIIEFCNSESYGARFYGKKELGIELGHLCSFKESLLEAVLEERTGRKFVVREIRRATPSNSCLFEILMS